MGFKKKVVIWGPRDSSKGWRACLHTGFCVHSPNTWAPPAPKHCWTWAQSQTKETENHCSLVRIGRNIHRGKETEGHRDRLRSLCCMWLTLSRAPYAQSGV